jgi:thiol-disulfide isomerase/thioredoxin
MPTNNGRAISRQIESNVNPRGAFGRGGVPTTNPRRERMVRLPNGRCPAAAALVFAVFSLGLSAHAQDVVMLDFWSPHCGPCMQMKPIVHSLEQAGLAIREVDTTRDVQLARQFNVDRIPCFVILANGREIEREVGYTSSERLQQMFQRAYTAARARGQSPDGLAAAQPAQPRPDFSQGPVPQPNNQPWPSQPTPRSDGTNNPSLPPDSSYAKQLPAPRETSTSASDFPPNLIAATVRLRVEDPQGRSFGTGTIIDSRSGEALVVTCGHLFRESKGKGAVNVELFEVTSNGLKVVGQVTGQVISYDLDRDVALVSIRPNREVKPVSVAPPRTSVSRLDRVASIGCSNGSDPTLLATRVTAIDRYQGAPNIEAAGAPVEGRSGGGLFNTQGQLIGVCYAADQEGNEGLYAGLESIHAELDRLGLKEIYAKNDSGNRSQENPTGLTARGQEAPLVPITPVETKDPAGQSPGTVAKSDDAKATTPKGLSQAEQAAWEEIMSRTATSEVICIIRAKESNGQSEVITLDSVSPDFVRALAERRKAAPQEPVVR